MKILHGRSKSRGRPPSRSRKNIVCYHCGKEVHKKKTLCRFYKRELETKQGNTIEQKCETNSALTAAGEVYLIIEDDSCFSAIRDDDLSWVVDSGASFHLTSHKEYFTSYTSGDFGYVRMRNSDSSTIVGKGTVCIERSTGYKLIFEDFRHVRDIRLNLMSVGKLDDIGLGSHFGEGK